MELKRRWYAYDPHIPLFDHTGGNMCEMTPRVAAYYEDSSLFDAVVKLFAQFSMDQLA